MRERGEIARLLKYAYPGGVAVDRLMPRLATVAAALNANDPCLARIAAVHLRIPDLPSSAARDALVAENALIKYAHYEGGGDWNPALHPRTGTRRPIPAGSHRPTDLNTNQVTDRAKATRDRGSPKTGIVRAAPTLRRQAMIG